MAMNTKKRRSKGSRTLTIIFYTVYFVLTLALVAGLLFANSKLERQLKNYELTHADNRSQEIFREWFADPDWARLYAMAGIADSRYESSSAFSAFMNGLVGEQELTYLETSAGLTGQRKYLLKLGSETIGWFTLENRAGKVSRLPQWELGQVHLNHARNESVTVLTPEDVTVKINGVALTADHVTRIDTTLAQEYLPQGIHASRTYTHYLQGLMTTPQVTAEDSQGNPLEVIRDEETGIFLVPQAAEETITRELQSLSLKAAKACIQFRITHGYLQELDRYFAVGSDVYEQLVDTTALVSEPLSAPISWGDESVTEFCRYGESVFSVRIRLPASYSGDDGIQAELNVDHTFFFRLEDAQWKCYAITDENVTEPLAYVRVTFQVGEQVILSHMYPQNAAELPLPIVSAPSGQVFTGWFRRETVADGATAYILVYGPGQTDAVSLSPDSLLEPMTLYALFETVE